MARIYVHIGTHRTGSTSLQSFLLDRAALLHDGGFDFYRGQHIESNHIELYLAAMRPWRDSFARLGAFAHVRFDEAYTKAVAARVQSFIQASRAPNLIFTSEGLALLRFPDELEKLGQLLDTDSHEVSFVLCLRDRSDFLRSYTEQLLKVPGRRPSTDTASALYVEPDSWLADFDALTASYRRAFGPDAVTIIDYDQQMRLVGNIIPSFMEAIGMQGNVDANAYFLNGTQKQVRCP